MKIKISNFYNIRFFKDNCIPVSTALYDPKWYHQNTFDNNFYFIDKNNVINGIREELLSPKAVESKCTCKECTNRSGNCEFLQSYFDYLKTINFKYLLDEFSRIAKEVQKITFFSQDPEIILLVYEKEDNPCSERHALKKLFKDNGIDLEDWKLEA